MCVVNESYLGLSRPRAVRALSRPRAVLSCQGYRPRGLTTRGSKEVLLKDCKIPSVTFRAGARTSGCSVCLHLATVTALMVISWLVDVCDTMKALLVYHGPGPCSTVKGAGPGALQPEVQKKFSPRTAKDSKSFVPDNSYLDTRAWPRTPTLPGPAATHCRICTKTWDGAERG